ncbi:MAG: cbb3-type cytochrome c oxidase N-terminal domain-containing protein [Thermodesulfovibrionales bacterium]|jgi:hypothetical protein
MAEEMDNLEDFEAKETAHKLPIGWLILYFGLILWGVWYLIAYTPVFSGWSQGQEYEESLKK